MEDKWKALESLNRNPKPERSSNFELFRIISMLAIVAHHYVVNSGLLDVIQFGSDMRFWDAFLLVFGWGGKTAINCFVLISGYFLCHSKYTGSRLWKLICELMFYDILIYLIFALAGYQELTILHILKIPFEYLYIADDFISGYLCLYLLVPFLNKLIDVLSEREHRKLLILLIALFSILASIPGGVVITNYVEWFVVLYLTASYIRRYPCPVFEDKKLWRGITAVFLLLSWASVLAAARAGMDWPYRFVSDSNQILAFGTAVSAFLWFKNLKIGCNKWINIIAASTFGVLLIHANSDAMRAWLWGYLLNNVAWYEAGNIVVLHAVLSVAAVYVVCTILDWLRITMMGTAVRTVIKWRDMKK